MRLRHGVAAVSICLLLPGCSVLDALQVAPPLDYQCPYDLRFTAHLYRDMATLDGMRGHAVLKRVIPSDSQAAAPPLRYADNSVRAEFGLGEQGRLVRLDYTGIPDPIYCTHITLADVPVIPPHAVNYDGPRPLPPRPDPNAPTQTNLRTRDGQPVRVD
ncbi:MAG: hypothetical protein LBH31_02410 [Burkholderiaceae bacterium]|jgi:hypothetical protein|nr:hypothetical protein [Burkholderiaceae bacterium]